MRGVVATRWLGVAAVVAVAFLVAVTAEEPRAVGEFVAVHRHFPRETRFGGDAFVKEVKEIGWRGGEVERVERNGERNGERMQWRFNPFNPFQTFGVHWERHVHRKCGMAAKLGSWWWHMFGHHHDHGHGHRHHDEEHRRDHGHDHRFERGLEHHHRHHHRHFAWNFLRNIGRWFSAIPSFLSDVPALIGTWSARVGGRKPPTVESVAEPLDMHALQKPSSPSLSCTLREKLSHVFAAVAEEVATTGSTENDDIPSDAIKRNLKMFMGDSMQLRIVKSICDTPSLSSCEQEFCDVFLSHPKSGVLMAFRILGLNPLKAATNPKVVTAGLLPSSKPLARPDLSPNVRDMIVNLRKTHRLAHIVFQRVLAANSNENSVRDFMPRGPKDIVFNKRSGGEMNPCKACLRQEIFRFKKLSKKAMNQVCENPVDSFLEQSCHFAKENRYVFKTLFAYKFRFWERAALVCRNRKACDSPFTPSTETYEPALHSMVKVGETQNPRQGHFDFNTFRNPRGVKVVPFTTSSMHWKGLDCRQRALQRAAMLRGHALDAIASELLKAEGSLSLQREHGPIIVVEFMARPQLETIQEMHSIPLSLGASLPQKWNFLHSVMNMEPGTMQNFEQNFAGAVELEPLHEILKKPVVDSTAHSDEVMEDAIAKPHDLPDVTSTSAVVPLELPSSVESNVNHPDI